MVDFLLSGSFEILQAAKLSTNSIELVVESIKVVVHCGTDGVKAFGCTESLLRSIEEPTGDTLLLVSGGLIELKIGSLVLVEISHASGGKWITFTVVKDRVGTFLSVILFHIRFKVNKSWPFIAHDKCEILHAAPLSINSIELVIEGIEVVVHSDTDGVHALGFSESSLRSVEELTGDTLLLVRGGTIEQKIGSPVLVEISHTSGGQRITLAEIKDRVGSLLSMVLLHISVQVLEDHPPPSIWNSSALSVSLLSVKVTLELITISAKILELGETNDGWSELWWLVLLKHL